MRGRWKSTFLIGLVVTLGRLPTSAALSDIVHPAFELKVIPMPALYRTTGMQFLSDGRMVLATTQLIPPYGDVPAASTAAKLYVVSGLTGNMDNIQVKDIANNWMQMTGITVVNDTIYVSDRDAQYQILDKENPTDLKANRKKIISWPDEGTWNRGRFWHQYLFTPIFYQGYFYAPYSGSIGEAGMSNVPPTSSKSGAFFKWKVGGALEIVAGGLRSPNGLNISPTGDMMVTDNQGGWLPSSTFALMRPGKFYGCRNTTPNFAESWPYQPPVAWLPHGDIRRSPTQPIYVPTGAYQGDWLMGDAFHPGLIRVNVDTVKGEYQGGVFWFSRGTGTAAINRLIWGPDGSLYMGTIEHIGSLPIDGPTPMYRLVPKVGVSVFEMKAISLLTDGFQIEFTEPVDKATIGNAAFGLSQWKYVRVEAYGEGRTNDPVGSIAVTGTEVSEDGKRVHVKVNKLTTDRVVYFKLTGVKSASGKVPLDNESWYTLNLTSDKAWNPAVRVLDRNRTLGGSRLLRAIRSSFKVAGQLDVEVNLTGAYTLSIRTLKGVDVTTVTGNGPGHHLLSQLDFHPGVHFLVLRQGEDILAQKVLF